MPDYTIGTGGDYTTLQSWEDAAPATLTEVWRGLCKKQVFSGSGNMLTIGGSTSSPTAYKELTCEPGASFADDPDVATNPLRYNESVGAAITSTVDNARVVSINERYARVVGLQIRCTSSGASGSSVLRSEAQDTAYIRCIAEHGGNSNAGFAARMAGVGGKLISCVLIQRKSGANYIAQFEGGNDVINCTLVSPSDITAATVGVNFTSGANTIKNCAVFGASAFSSGSVTITTCASDAGSPPSGVSSETYANCFENVNTATADYRLKSGSPLIDAGTYDATNAPTDIKGTAFGGGTTDIGCWEYVSGGGPITVDIGQATEANSALGFSRLKSRQIVLSGETDTALGFLSAKLRAVLQAIETDTAFELSGSSTVVIGQAVETDAAFSMASAKLLSILQAVESDAAFQVTWSKLRDIGLGTETDTAFAMATVGSVPIGLATEADTAQVITRLKMLGIDQANETDTGFTVTRLKTWQIGMGQSSGIALDFTVSKRRTVGQGQEIDSAIPFSADGSITVLIGIAAESGSAFAFGRNKTILIGLAGELDTAFDVVLMTSGSIGQAAETDTAPGFDRSKYKSIGQAIETDTALIFTSDSVITVRAPSGRGYTPERVISARPAQHYPKRYH